MDRVQVELFGSLAFTGDGHGTDRALLLGLEGDSPEGIDVDTVTPRVEAIRKHARLNLAGTHAIAWEQPRDLIFRRKKALPYHSNAMRFTAFDASGNGLDRRVFYSVGGGFVVSDEAAGGDPLVEDSTTLPYRFRSGAELRAKALDMPAVAQTDHGNLFGTVEFYEKARANGVKPIIGCEVYFAGGSRFEREKREREEGGFDAINHLLLLAMNEQGYQNLMYLVSKAYLEGFYYRPRIDWSLLEERHEGLICTSGCLSAPVPRAIMHGEPRRAWEVTEQFQQLFGDRYYLEIQRHGIPAQDTVNEELFKMSADLGVPLVATNDAHYLEEDDHHHHDALLCIGTAAILLPDEEDRGGGYHESREHGHAHPHEGYFTRQGLPPDDLRGRPERERRSIAPPVPRCR